MTTHRQAAAELLHRAAQLIDEDGWTQGYLGNPISGWCALGAIQHAADDNDDDDGILNEAALGYAMRAVEAAIGNGDITHWNDTNGRIAAEVIDTLRTTADQLTKDRQ